MKVINLNLNKIRSMDDTEIEKLHTKLHKLHRIVRQNKSVEIEFGDILREKHKLVVSSLISRGIDHKTTII